VTDKQFRFARTSQCYCLGQRENACSRANCTQSNACRLWRQTDVNQVVPTPFAFSGGCGGGQRHHRRASDRSKARVPGAFCPSHRLPPKSTPVPLSVPESVVATNRCQSSRSDPFCLLGRLWWSAATTGEPPTRPRPASLGNVAAATRLRFISHLRARRRVRGSGIVRTEMLIDRDSARARAGGTVHDHGRRGSSHHG
jgi:hypothetical protein